MTPAILAALAIGGVVAFGAIQSGVRLDLIMGNDGTASSKGKGVNLQHFSPSEFTDRYGTNWYSQMHPELLRKLDAFRERWGHPVMVSNAKGAMGRHQGPSGTSQHNVDAWGEVRAIDVFPKLPAGASGYRYIEKASERARAYQVARAVGFTGIGLYTDTSPGDMLHVDVRPSSGVATWSRVDGNYLDIGQVIA
ncbi:hypothetical protein [Marinobacter sp. LN3S78]|uniref:hypothetical protein n=1 Tax=Marinobacter sp. LN3S78 TaxID=3382300 RepID=UPI00387B6C81